MPQTLTHVRDLVAHLGTTDDAGERSQLLGIYVASLDAADTSHLDGIEFDPSELDDLEIVDGFYGIRDYLSDLADTDEADTDSRATLMETYIRSLRLEANARPVLATAAA